MLNLKGVGRLKFAGFSLLLIGWLCFSPMPLWAQSEARWIEVITGPDRIPEMSVVESDFQQVIFDVRIFGMWSEEVSTKGRVFNRLSMPECGITNVIGEPNLPVLRKMIQIPFGAQVDVDVIRSEFEEKSVEELGIAHRIIPIQYPIPKIEGGWENAQFVIDEQAYRRDSFYPERLVEKGEIGIVRAHRFVTVEISPVSYNPVSGRLRLYSDLRVRVTLRGSDKARTEDMLHRYASPPFEELCRDLFINYSTYQDIIKGARSTPTGYLIIVHDNFSGQVAPLQEWKRKKGFDVTVATTTQTGTTTGSIKNYIQNAYDNWPNPPTYVLFFGDVGFIPTYTGTESNSATDLYYVQMDGDIFGDIGRARFPVRSTTEATDMLNKLLYYEKPTATNLDWMRHECFIASQDASQTAEHTHNFVIQNYLSGVTVDKIWQRLGGSTSDITNSVNAGRSIVCYSGHGLPTGWGCVPFNQTNVRNLSNTNEYPLVLSHACLTNTFDQTECFGETWVKEPDKGGIAFWGASNSTYWDEDDILEKRMFRAAFQDAFYSVSSMTERALWDLYQHYGNIFMVRYYFDIYNVLGEPSVDIWTQVAAPLHVTHPNMLDAGVASTFDVDVSSGGNPVPGALVCLYKGTEVHENETTNASGVASFSLPALTQGKMYVTVTKHNYNPYEGCTTVDPVGVGVDWLRTVQNSGGSWAWADGTGTPCVGVTALAVLAILNHTGNALSDPDVMDALGYILTRSQASVGTDIEGCIESVVQVADPPRERIGVYETSLATTALIAALAVTDVNLRPIGWIEAIQRARQYLLNTHCVELSWRPRPDPDDMYDYLPSSDFYGGWGYPRSNWADLSNTQFGAWALGCIDDMMPNLDPAWVAGPPPVPDYRFPALNTYKLGYHFLFGCQNLDGGFTYQPGGGSYGSMSAAGLWSLWYADKDNPDYQARAIDGRTWFDGNISCSSNPGHGNAWYYYYVFTAAKAFTFWAPDWGTPQIGAYNDWYDDCFCPALLNLQDPGGWWPKLYDNEPRVMATAEALLALETRQSALPFWARIYLSSPALVQITDPIGRRCGAGVPCEIPGASYAGGEHQTIEIPTPLGGLYTITVTGTAKGNYRLNVDTYVGDHPVSSELWIERITAGEEHEWLASVATVVGPNAPTNFPPARSNVLIPNTDECVNPGEYVCLPILLDNNTTEFGGFELEVEFDYTAMTFVDAEPGEAMEGFEKFTYRLLPCPLCPCCKYKILLYGQYDMPDGVENIGDPIPVTATGEYQELVNLCFVVNSDENLRGLKIPVCWEWEGTVVDDIVVEDWNCQENTFSSWSGDTLYASVLYCQFNEDVCDAPTDRIQPILLFQQGICGQNCGGVDVYAAGPGLCKRGDINMNDMTHEVADAVLFASYFVEGTSVFRYDESYQICATDVNADGRTLTLSDLVYLIRVILHDAVEMPKLTPSSDAVNITVSGNSVRTECAVPIGAILFEFDGVVNPTLLADMEMVAKDNKVLVWSSKGKSFSTAEVLTFEGEAQLVTATAVDRDSRELSPTIAGKVAPPTFALHPAYPNPFNPFTTLSFTLPENVDYSLKIYNVAGQLVRSYESIGSVGLNVINWDSKSNAGDEVASGIYFYRLTAGTFSATEKMVILK